MTIDSYIQSVVDNVPRDLPLREQIAMELRAHIAERVQSGQPLDEVLRNLGDPLKLAESYLAAEPLKSARLGPRVMAKIIDFVIVFGTIAFVVCLIWFTLPRERAGFVPLIGILAVAVAFPLYTALTEYRSGRTLGKRLMGIRVVRESGARITLGQSLIRQLPLFAQVFIIDALFALFTDRKQRAFELLTKTRAVMILLCIVLFTTSPSLAQTATTPIGTAPGRLFDIGGRKLHLHCTGAGVPTVILESGASSFAVDWALVQPAIARGHRVCSYDRAGMGWSEPGPPERADRVVRDLHALLQTAGEKPPYVLVGHSRGGVYTRIYQRRYPDEVVGMVQIDPSHESGLFTMMKGQPVTIASLTADQLLASIPPGNPPSPPSRNPQTGAPFDLLPSDLYKLRVEFERRLIAAMSGATITRDLVVDVMEGERAALTELLEASQSAEHPLGQLPLVVLTRGRGVAQAQKELHASLAAQSTRGRHAVVEGAYHEIHLSHPDAVIAAIEEVIALSQRP